MNHVLPTGRTARFASALRVDDFRKHIHVVRGYDRGLARASRRTSRRSPRPRASTRTRSSVRPARRDREHDDERPPAAARRPARARGLPLAPARRVGAAQHQREPVRRRRRSSSTPGSTRSRRCRCTAIPDRGARELRDRARRVDSGSRPSGSSAPTAPTRCCRRCCSPTAAPGRRALVFEPTYALHSHIARITGTEVVVGERRDDFTVDPDAAVPLDREHDPPIVFLCSPNNPTGTVEPAATVEALLDAAPGLVVVDEAYGEFADRSALELVDDERAARRRAHVLEGVVAGRAAPRVLRRARRGWSTELEKVVLPYHLDVGTQLAGTRRAAVPARRWTTRVALARRGARAARRRARRRSTASPSSRRARTSCCSGSTATARRSASRPRVWQALVDRGVLVRDFSRWPGVEDCLRVTVGTPEENDAFLVAPCATVAARAMVRADERRR